MKCVACGGAAISERPERTAQGYRRFRCRDCGKQFNERTGGSLNRTQYPSDVIALVVFWRLRYKLSLRDLPEMFLLRGIEFTYEAVRDWEAKLTPLLSDNLRPRRGGGSRVRRSWYVDETYHQSQWPMVLSIPSDRPHWRSGGRDAEQKDPRYGRGRGSSFDLPKRSLVLLRPA